MFSCIGKCIPNNFIPYHSSIFLIPDIVYSLHMPKVTSRFFQVYSMNLKQLYPQSAQRQQDFVNVQIKGQPKEGQQSEARV